MLSVCSCYQNLIHVTWSIGLLAPVHRRALNACSVLYWSTKEPIQQHYGILWFAVLFVESKFAARFCWRFAAPESVRSALHRPRLGIFTISCPKHRTTRKVAIIFRSKGMRYPPASPPPFPPCGACDVRLLPLQLSACWSPSTHSFALGVFVCLFACPQEPDALDSLKMEVGIEDCLHIEFEYDKSAYHLQDVVIGKVRFCQRQRRANSPRFSTAV